MMKKHDILQMLGKHLVIPAARNEVDFAKALDASSPLIIMLFGDILSIPRLIDQAKKHHKVIVMHVDLIEGVGKDKSGVQYLSALGIKAIISTKPHLIKTARSEDMAVIQRLFLMDSESLRTGIHLLQSFKPDALEVLPGFAPKHAIEQLMKVGNIPIMTGGLITTEQDVAHALATGVCAISTTRQELWEYSPQYKAEVKN